jgi:hypothetical protein
MLMPSVAAAQTARALAAAGAAHCFSAGDKQQQQPLTQPIGGATWKIGASTIMFSQL